MRELHLQGIHDDDEHLVLVDSDGEQYTLRIDESLRAAVRRDRPALGMIRAEQSTPLRPREIQAMLRAGRSPEAIAEMSGISAEHIRRYEGPVLAEREYIAQRARRFHVGRGGGPLFGDVVEERLGARQADAERTWDAWRLPDGTWTVELVFTAGGRERTAHWIVDVDRQTVLAEDDEARWLTEGDAEPASGPAGRGRLTPIRASVYDVEADGAFDPSADTARPAIRTVPRRGQSDHPSAIAPEELDALQARRGLRPVPMPGPREDEEPVWETLDEASADPAAAEEASSSAQEQSAPRDADAEAAQEHDATPEAAADSTDPTQDAHASAEAEHSPEGDAPGAEADAADVEDTPAVRPLRHHPAGAPREADIEYLDTVDLTPLPGFEDDDQSAQASDSSAESTDDASAAGAPQTKDKDAKEKTATRRGTGRKSSTRRSSVPSWDEIVFGSRGD